MKDFLKSGGLILLTVTILYLIYLRECKVQKCPPDGSIIVTEAFLDSLRDIAEKPPVIITKDSIIYLDTIIYITHNVPVPVVIDGEYKVYRDSIVNDSIRVWDELHVKGSVEWWDKWYKPVIHQRKIYEFITKPYPVVLTIPEKSHQLYGSLIFGGNGGSAAFGGGLDYINKNNYLYGVQYQRMIHENFFSVRIGMRIMSKK